MLLESYKLPVYEFTSERFAATNKSFSSHETAGLPYYWTITRKCYNYTMHCSSTLPKINFVSLYENDVDNIIKFTLYT